MDADEALVARSADGDEAAFAELVRRHRDRVFRLAVSILGRPFAPEAEEIAQEVFLRAHRALHTFRGEARFGTWLYRITFNLAASLKSRVRFRVPHAHDEALAERAAAGDDALGQLEARRRDDALAECLGELPDVYQASVRLYYWMDCGVAEVAALLDVPENTVKSYLHRARSLLRAMLRQRGFDDV